MIRIVALLLLLGLVGAQARPRVASINMCTDQLVLALADDEQILGLSALSRDPLLSFYRARAVGKRLLSGTAEDVLPLRPDLVVTATLARAHTRHLLAAAGLRVEEFGDAGTIAEVKAQIMRMGTLLEQPERARSAVAAIAAAQAAAAPASGMAARPALPLERRGWVSGRQSLLTEVLAATGFSSLGATVSENGRRLPLEVIVTLKPEVLIVGNAALAREDQGAAMLHHPALTRLRTAQRVVIPDSLLVCAGPMIVEAFELLRSARDKLPERL